MADEEKGEQLEKRAEVPEPDPIADSSLSGQLMIWSLVMMGTLVWSLYDELIWQRPWKSYQGEWVETYTSHLNRIKKPQAEAERELRESSGYEALDDTLKSAEEQARPRVADIDNQISAIDIQVGDLTERFQDLRAWIAAKSYELETSTGGAKERLQRQIETRKDERFDLQFREDGNTVTRNFNFHELEELYNNLRDAKARLTAERIEVTREATEARRKRDEYFQNNFSGLSEQQIDGLLERMRGFDFNIKQIHITEGDLVDRCESCHLGIREPLTLTKAAMGGEGAFTSHPNPELFRIHDPDRFGCSTCHGGNGRATVSVEKGHGRYKHWLWPLYYLENVQAGCNSCHNADRITAEADVLNHGKDLFQSRGCYSCHRYEGFDRDTDALTSARQSIRNLEMEREARLREIRETRQAADDAETDEEAQRLIRRIDAIRQTISLVDTRIAEYELQSKYLMKDVKKFGPNLKEIKVKLRKEWLLDWLNDPQAFRPGTKMPSFRLNEEENKAMAAFLWQSAIDATIPSQPPGNPANGRELFKTIGCLACHSIDGELIGLSEGRIGGDFAADLSRVGEKANYDYIVRWVHNPRQRLSPYSPTLKRDLTAEDYSKKGLPFIFDDDHSRSPVDGRELLVHNMTVMPNFRLTTDETRDVASFLVSLKRDGVRYREASYLDDPALRDRGERLVKMYGCASCHEIRGLEDEQRIGTELTVEGTKPIERLDFALLTHEAKKGIDPQTGEEDRPWYNHKGFFENKLRSPGIYDKGKEKPREEQLRMPNIYLTDFDVRALTTFLLGSVETSMPQSLKYNPAGGKKHVQDGWWVVQKYNCMGCHNVLIGQDTVLMGLPMYQDPDGQGQLPPRLTSQGARVNSDWLLKFLSDPSLAPAAASAAVAHVAGNAVDASLGPQMGLSRNGVRSYLQVRMPTFNFSPNELQALINFFMGASSQPQPYVAEQLDPLTPEEQGLARALFTSPGAPCLRCHMVGDPAHDIRASAPNFLIVRERLKASWTERWLLDPQFISPGTNMPSELFRRDTEHERWVFNGPTPPAFASYEGDHVALLVRYMFELTPEEQRRLIAGGALGPAITASARARPAPRARHLASLEGFNPRAPTRQ